MKADIAREYRKTYIVLLAAALLASLFFPFLYRFNNKYSRNSVQAADGILALSDTDLEETPLRFLVSGWAFYPGALLSPEDIRSSEHYMQYLSVGAQTGLSGPAYSSPYGCGTYQLTFFLPENASGYAIELPELFSAYTLWLNDTLVLTLGDPASGISQIQNRLVTFPGGSPVTLTLAVSNYSHFYGGMVYPPAFGTPLAVNTMRALRFAACLFSCVLSLLVSFLSLYFGIRAGKSSARLFGLISLSAFGYSSYPLLHMLIALPVFPWYTLELFCGYLTVWLILLLQSRICRVGFLLRTTGVWGSGLFCLVSLAYGLCSDHLSPAAIRLFSASVAVFKALTSLWLLIAAASYLRQQQRSGLSRSWETAPARVLFLSSVIEACALLWDRLLPDYEPIVGGWFPEWGSFFVAAAIGYSLWCEVVQGYVNGLIFEQEQKQVSRQLAMQTEYSRQITEAMEEKRRLLHDVRHHLRAIDRMAAEHGDTDICRFLSQLEQQAAEAPGRSPAAFCKNPAVNALIEYYAGAARSAETTLTVRLALPDRLPLNDVELCTILGNLLDNAAEACARMAQGERRILLATETRGHMFFLKVENTCDRPPHQKNGLFLSAKTSPGHGIGLSSVRKIVETHGGVLDLEAREGSFFAGITLELP